MEVLNETRVRRVMSKLGTHPDPLSQVFDLEGVKVIDQSRACGVSLDVTNAVRAGLRMYSAAERKKGLPWAWRGYHVGRKVMAEAAAQNPGITQDPGFIRYGERLDEAKRLLDMLDKDNGH